MWTRTCATSRARSTGHRSAGEMIALRRKVRIGVVGAGAFGRRHVEYLSWNPNCEVAGIADPAPAAAAFAAERGLACYDSAESMLDGASPDGVIIATPNAL